MIKKVDLINQAPTQDESNPYKQGWFDKSSPYNKTYNKKTW